MVLSVLDKSSLRLESYRSPTWRASTGTAKRWLHFGSRKLRVTPYPSYGDDFTVGYIEEPAEVSLETGGDIDDRIAEHHHEAICYAAASYLFRLDGDRQDLGRSQELMAKFESLALEKSAEPGDMV